MRHRSGKVHANGCSRGSTSLEPLHLTIAAAVARELLTIRKNSGKNIQGVMSELMKSKGVFMMPRDKMTKAFMFDRRYRISWAERSDWARSREKLPANGEIWYMDLKG